MSRVFAFSLCLVILAPQLLADVTVTWDDDEWCARCNATYTWPTECNDNASLEQICKVRPGIPSTEVLEVGPPNLVCSNTCSYCSEIDGAEPSCDCTYSQSSGWSTTITLGGEVELGSIWELNASGSYTYGRESTSSVTNSAEYSFGSIVTIEVFEIVQRIRVTVELDMELETWARASNCPEKGQDFEHLLATVLCGSKLIENEEHQRTYSSVVSVIACP